MKKSLMLLTALTFLTASMGAQADSSMTSSAVVTGSIYETQQQTVAHGIAQIKESLDERCRSQGGTLGRGLPSTLVVHCSNQESEYHADARTCVVTMAYVCND